MIGWGLLYYAFAVIQVPMARDLSWSATLISGGFSLALLVSAFTGMIFGPHFDRAGAWVIMVGCSLAGMAVLALWSWVTHPLAYLALMPVLGLAMAGSLYEPAFYLVARWFPRRRASAITLLTGFGALASPCFLPLTERLDLHLGWRGTLAALALLGLISVIPLLLSLPRRHHSLAPTAQDRRALARAAFAESRFRWLLAGYVAVAITAVAVPIHLVPTLVARGESLAFAASITGGIAAIGLIGRLAFAVVGDGAALVVAAAAAFAAMTLGVVVLIALPGRSGTLAFVGLFGFGYGALWPTRAALVARAWGGPALATISARFALGPNLATACAPVLTAILIGAVGTTPAFAILAALPTLGALAILRAEGLRPASSRNRSSAGGS